MQSYNKISDLVEVKTFEPVINLQWGNDKDSSLNLLNSYIITEDIASHFETILESITLRRSSKRLEEEGKDIDHTQTRRSFIVRGQYGTGKSYFLLVISSLIESVYNGKYDELINKFNKFPNIVYHLKILKDSEHLITVRVNADDEINKDFDDLIQESIIEKLNIMFGECYFESAYDKAIDTLENYRQNNQKLYCQIEEALSSMSLDYEELKSGLLNRKSNYINKYKEVIKRVFTLDISLHKESLNKFIDSATEYVKKKGYKGFFIIVDELSAYLKSSQEEKRINKDLANLQSLAEATACNRGNNIFFLVSMHIDLKNFLDKITTNEDDVNKVTGRFKALPLSFDRGNELIKNLISIDRSGLSQIQSKYEKQFYKLKDIKEEDYRECYPIHPLSLNYLKSVTENFAQKERTIFQFVAEELKAKKLYENILDESGNLNLIKAKDVFDFFKSEIRQKRSDAMVSINETLEYCANKEEEEIAKTLIIARLTVLSESSSTRSRLDIHDISKLTLIPEDNVIQVLRKFTESSRTNIFYDEEDKSYSFIESGSTRVNLEDIVRSEMTRLNPDTIFKSFIKDIPGSQIKKEYKIEPKKGVTPIERLLEGKAFSVTYLDKKLKDMFHKGDGAINFIVPKFSETLDDINEKDIIEKLDQISDNRINACIAVPKSFNIKEDTLLRLEALEIARTKEDIQNDENLRKRIENDMIKLRRSVEKQVKGFSCFKNFKFIFAEGIKNFDSEYELYEYMMHRHYTKFPEIETERLSGRSVTNKLINNFLSKGETQIPENSNQEEHRQIKETLVPLGIATIKDFVGGYRAVVTRPTERQKRSKEIWDMVVSEKYNTNSLLEDLSSPPYGLTDFIVELYLSAALYHGDIMILSGGNNIQNNSASLGRICDKKNKIEKVVRNANIEDVVKLKSIWGVAAIISPSRAQKKFKPEEKINNMVSLRLDISNDLGAVIKLLESKRESFKYNDIKIDNLDSVILGLKETIKKPMPDQLIKEFVSVPEKVYEDDFEKSLCKMEELFKGINILSEKLEDFKTLKNSMDSISKNKDVLLSINGLKSDDIDGLIFKYKELLKEPFNIELLKETKDKSDEIIIKYNSEFERSHLDYSDKLSLCKKQLIENPYYKVVEQLKRLNFSDAKDLESIVNPIMSKKSCENAYKIDKSHGLHECNCIGRYTDIEALESEKKNLYDTMEMALKGLEGLTTYYLESVRKLKTQEKEGLSFQDYMESSKEGLYETYRSVAKGLMDIDRSIESGLLQAIEKIVDPINIFIKKDTVLVDGPNKRLKSDIKRIGYRNLIDLVDIEINLKGTKYITVEDFKELIDKVLDENKERFKEIEL